MLLFVQQPATGKIIIGLLEELNVARQQLVEGMNSGTNTCSDSYQDCPEYTKKTVCQLVY
jgi:hypothetical protein